MNSGVLYFLSYVVFMIMITLTYLAYLSGYILTGISSHYLWALHASVWALLGSLLSLINGVAARIRDGRFECRFFAMHMAKVISAPFLVYIFLLSLEVITPDNISKRLLESEDNLHFIVLTAFLGGLNSRKLLLYLLVVRDTLMNKKTLDEYDNEGGKKSPNIDGDNNNGSNQV